jgi:hypothetical protein
MKSKLPLLLLIIYALEWAYLVLPVSTVVYQLYPFNGQWITKQAYVDFLARHIELCIFFYISTQLSTKHFRTLVIFFWLSVAYLMDYILTYNQPFGHFYFIPLSYGLYMGIAMCCLTIREILRS